MGIVVELPAQRKQRTEGLLDTSEGAKETGPQSWQWGPFESLPIDHSMSPATPPKAKAADVLSGSPDSAKHLISPCVTGSSSVSPSSSSRLSYSGTSPPFSGGCADSFGGKNASHRRLKKGSKGQSSNSTAFACAGDFQPSRWDTSRWGASSSFDDRSTRPGGNTMCKCAAGLTADVAAVCCCPFSLLHLLAIAFIKLPAALVTKTLARMKQKIATKRKRAAVHEEDDESVPASSCPPSRSRSYEGGDIQTWAPALAFGDQKLWRDYFDSPDTGIWSSAEFVKGKS